MCAAIVSAFRARGGDAARSGSNPPARAKPHSSGLGYRWGTLCVSCCWGIWLTPAMPIVTARPCCLSVRLLSGCFVDVDATRIFFAAPRPLTALSAALSAPTNCAARPL
jgi:hypothetical protein